MSVRLSQTSKHSHCCTLVPDFFLSLSSLFLSLSTLPRSLSPGLFLRPPFQDKEDPVCVEGRETGERTGTPAFFSLLLYSPTTTRRLTAPGGRAGRMIAAQLLAYFFTELKDDQLKKVSDPGVVVESCCVV